MEFEEEENGFHGEVPEFGAIFMSNIATKRECFKKKIMGLPLSKANFVKQVKCGMVLFLFEFERRELFGVYRASSDGAVNIAPHAFSSSGDCYPAQVRFTPIWDCSPLSEPEFRGAIRENYFSAKKFNFGLSQDQVRSLLMLFRTRKLRNKLPPRQFSRDINRRVGENSYMVDDEIPTASNGFPNENCIEPSAVIAYPNIYWDRENELNVDACSERNRIEDEYRVSFSDGGYLNNNYSDSPGRRRMDDDERILMNDIAGNSLNNDHPLTMGMRLAEGNQFSMDDTVKNDCKNRPSVMSSNDMADPVHFIRKNGGCLFTNRERIVNQSNGECGSGMIRLTESYGKLSNDCPSALATHYARSLLNDGAEELHNPDYTPAVSGNFNSENFLRNANFQHRLIHDNTENKHLKDCVDVSTIPSTHFVHPSHDTDKLYGDARSPVGWNKSEHSTFGGPGFHCSRNEYFHSLARDRRVDENTIEYDLGPSASNEQSSFRLNVDKQWVNADWYRKNNPENAASLLENFHRPTHLIGGNRHTEMKQMSPASCSMSFYETALPRITDAAKFDNTFSNFQDATITRALPCDNEFATSHCGCSSSSQVDHESSLVQNDCHSVGEQNLDVFLKDISMPYHEKLGSSTGLPDFAADHRQKKGSYLQSGIGESDLNAEFSENVGLNTTSSMVYRAPPSSRPYMAFPVATGPGEASLHGEYTRFSPLAIDSGCQSLGIKERVAMRESDEILYHHGGVPITDHNNNFDIYETFGVNDETMCNRLSELSHSDYKEFKRRSVFSRLSSKKCTLKDEVTGVHQNQVSLSKKQIKCKPLVKSHDNGEITVHGKHASVVEMDHNSSMISSPKKKRNLQQSIEQNVQHAQKETRAVDFKRRSEIKKSLPDCDTKYHLISVEMMSSESSVVKELLGTPPEHGNPTKELISEEKMPSETEIVVKEPACKLGKRRKLVRPVFGKSDVDHESSNVHALHEAFNDNAKFVKACQHNANQDIGPSSCHEHGDNKKQRFTSVLKNSSDPQDSSSRGLDGNISSQDNGSTNVISSTVQEHTDPNLKQSLVCGNKRREMCALLIKDVDVKDIGKLPQSVPLEADSEISPEEAPSCITGVLDSGTRDSATSEAANVGNATFAENEVRNHPTEVANVGNATCADKLLGAENEVRNHRRSRKLKSEKVTQP
ncbi:PREDICTED: uncharacterized protein LOC109153070 [Ipomoea nil]|uniref:uncharacterized protein LOC109153070 n=1 Tax=Ipomoea nil TaxID=35883 RepID=UPI000901FF19|nr:PREDICTED: uncharacterized protein LOC109153070 [Ipomoea nil]XP_019156367.1 PREDICTED: uncharacterized protein LOC109153070 [Ipomoea nil]XP_019156368.1 PREDICTED: uncharacterized protein LOC109153070 [Ipomoea nil]